ncbi:MAG: PIN domain-containing protein [bacterium]
MHIFIDTSVIYSEPFWKGNFPRQLLESAKQEFVNIYISEVVLKELRNNLLKQLEQEFEKVEKVNLKIKRITLNYKEFKIPDKNELLSTFDRYYESLFENENIVKLVTDNSILDEIIQRALDYKKPFTDNKSEFKDAVIWTTYYKYALSNELKNCFFLTNNQKDFEDNKGNLHPDLQNDYNEFCVYNSISILYKEIQDRLEKPKIEFKEWINSQKIDEEYVFNLLINMHGFIVNSKAVSIFDGVVPSDIIEKGQSGFFIEGYIKVKDIDWQKCEDIDINIVSDYAIISGVLTLILTFEIFEYESFNSFGDNKYNYLGTSYRDLKLYFDFILDKDEIPKRFEITNFE